MSILTFIQVRRLRIVAMAILSVTFVLVCSVATEGSKSTISAQPLLDTHNQSAVHNKKLKLTPKLGALPKHVPAKSPRRPVPWWLAVLFGLAFSCGWLFRSHLREPTIAESSVSAAIQDQESSNLLSPQNLEHTLPENAPENVQPSVDLAQDFPWDESLLDDHSTLSHEDRIEALQKQNKTKANIIEALELMLVENREKWLHRDQTEARLDQRIRTLTEDLRALRQIQ